MRTQEQIAYEQRAKSKTLNTLHRKKHPNSRWFNTPIEPRREEEPSRPAIVKKLMKDKGKMYY